MSFIERRKSRSERPAEAARLYLEQLAARQAFAAVALADADGLLIAGTRDRVQAEAVAAIAPLAATDPDGARGGLLDLVTRGQPLRVWGFDLEGTPCFLAAVGGAVVRPAEAEATLRRILAPSFATA